MVGGKGIMRLFSATSLCWTSAGALRKADLLRLGQEVPELARVRRGVAQRFADEVVAGDDPGSEARFEVHGRRVAQRPVRGIRVHQRRGIGQRYGRPRGRVSGFVHAPHPSQAPSSVWKCRILVSW